MFRPIAIATVCMLLLGTAAAQQTTPAPATAAQCVRPMPPVIPQRAPIGMTLEQMYALHNARDAYVTAADRYRMCLDDEIVRRRDTMFRTNAEMDPDLDVRAHEHSAISAERAQVMGQFVLMCLTWEDANGPYPRGCYLREAN